MIKRITLGFITVLFISCGTQRNGGLLAPASGDWGEILLVMDSTKWAGDLGNEIKATFQPNVEGLPRAEPLFTIRYINPLKLNGVLKSSRYMIFVTSFQSQTRQSTQLKNYFTSESIGTIMEDSTRFLHINENEFAKGQKVMYLFGKTDRILIKNIRENRKSLQGFFNNQEQIRMLSSLFAAKEVKGINKHLLDKHQFTLRSPFGYQIADERENFIWLRSFGAEIDKNIFISYKGYSSEDQLKPESLITWRDEIARQYIFEDPKRPQTFVLTEKRIPVVSEITNINKHYSVELKGLWRTNNLSMGGPFISYSLVDEELNRIYYVEGFLYSPGKAQRDLVRELEAILSTFQTESDLRKTS